MTMPIAPTGRGILLATVAVLALGAAPADAQQREGLFQMLGRIILGTGSAKVAIDTPQSVTAIEEGDLDTLQPKTLADVFKGVPGAQVAGASARMLGQAFNIRGIGNAEQVASEERIKVTVDGAPKFFEAYRVGSFFSDLDLYKRVEILRGPASSTLYGSGVIGGVIAFTTRDASDYLAEGESTALKFRAGHATNGDTWKAGVTWAQRAGNAEFLASLNRSRGGVMQDGSGTDILGTQHNATSGLVKGRLSFGNDGDQALTLAYSRTGTDLRDSPVTPTGGASIIPVFGIADVRSRDETATLTYENGFAGSDLLDLKVQLSWTDTWLEKTNIRPGPGLMCMPGTFQVLCPSEFEYETLALKVENRSDLSAGDWRNTLTLGIQLSEQDRKATSSLGVLGFHPQGEDRKLGLYALGEFVWNDRLTLIPGFRVDFGDRKAVGVPPSAGAADTEDTARSYSLAAMYDLSDSLSVFGTLASTQRMPTLDELYSYGPQVASLNLRKETARTVELGLAWKREGVLSEGDSLNLKLTAFHNDIDDMIVRNSTGTPGVAPYFVNLRSAQLWGGELEAAYDAERWFASLAWAKVKSKDGTTGLQLSDTPAENVALTLGWKLPEKGLTLGWRGYYFDAITNYSPGSTTVNANASAPAYDTHDLFLTWAPQQGALEGLEVNLTVENVFDATYRNNLALDNAPGMNAKLTIGKSLTW
ncbi:MAG: TonB-dependent receptor domain-containing protein [Tabrizicola sp.]